MEQKKVEVDSLVAQWIVEKKLKELVMGKTSATRTLLSKKWRPCSIELQEDFTPGLRAAKGNIQEIPYEREGAPKEDTSEIQGPVWSDEENTLYVGHASHGVRSGSGLQVVFSGRLLAFVYEGQFRNDKAQGIGRVVFSNGDWYVGQFQDGKAHGKGKYRNNVAKCVLDGNFENDVPHGRGVETWDDGSVFEGQFNHGHKHGEGIFSTKLGVLKGEFLNGEFHGKGVLKSKTNRIYEGSWHESVLVSPAKIYLDDQCYEGHINKDFLPEGHGFVKNSKQKIQGNFKNGYLYGQGNSTDLLSGKTYVNFYEKGVLESAIAGENGFSDHQSPERQLLEPKHPVITGISQKTAQPVLNSPTKPDKPKKKGCLCFC